MTSFYRFSDLVERKIVNNRVTLGRWIKNNDFPPGVMLGPNSRAWPVDEVERWAAERSKSGFRANCYSRRVAEVRA